MQSRKDREYQEKLVGKIMDAYFEADESMPHDLFLDMVDWLLDEKDAELKDMHVRRIFDELMDDDLDKKAVCLDEEQMRRQCNNILKEAANSRAKKPVGKVIKIT